MTLCAATILIVDDEAPNRKLLEVLLQPEGYKTLSAASGEEALALMAQQAPDLILLDIMMPGMDGYEVATRLKANPATANIPIIMVTALADRSARLAGLHAGAEEFLTKPVDRAELWLRVRNLLRLKEYGDLLRNHSRNLELQVQARTAELQLFRTAMDATADAVFLANCSDTQFVEVNATACTLLGYAREELMTMVPEQPTAPGEVAHLFEAIITGPLDALTETSLRRKDGSEVEVEVQRQTLESSAQSIMVCVVRDITERKQARQDILHLIADLEERVRQRTEQLLVANQELEAFSYSVSHDLRTPLSTINAFSSLLGKEIGASERGKHYLARIRAGAIHMGELIDALLALAQVSRSILRRERVDISAMAETILNQYREREPARIVELDIEPALAAHGDPRLLQQVLDNLLGNAWKFSGQQAHACIAVKRASCTDGQEEFAIRDNGIGFDMAYAAKLFVPFEQLHSQSEFSGHGIGLATVYRIVTRHGGTIRAESAPGQGATFYFTLEKQPKEDGSSTPTMMSGLPPVESVKDMAPAELEPTHPDWKTLPSV
ncbi:MAG: domain S-box protein [Polaromonas sp.]|nr:domain S-box protein [Polaromonas sp.]